MCDPLTIAGVALTGLSTGINYAAQSKAANAREDAMAAERVRQNGLDQEAAAVNTGAQDRYENFEGQQTGKSAELADYFAGQEVAAPSAEAALPTSASNITVREISKQKGQAKDFTNRTGAALGELRSFGDLLGDVSRLQARDAGTIGQIGGFKRGSSSVLPYELEEAASAGNGLKLFGDIAGGLGQLTSSAGLSGGTVPVFGTSAPKVAAPAARGTMAAGRTLDRASMPGYAGVSSLYGAR